MNIKQIINELVHNKVIDSEDIEYKQLSGGTVSKLYLLENTEGNKYVVKSNEPQVIESEAIFLNFYKESNLLPRLQFLEPSSKYIVYSFISGQTDYSEKNKKELLKALIDGLLNTYKPVSNDKGWGWADQPKNSWHSFLRDEISEKYKIIGLRLDNEDHNFVFNLVNNIKDKRNQFLLHGDCGIHNFIFESGRLKGVIDPTPVVGDPLYDLIYAFCSSPDDLTKETIESGLGELRFTREKPVTNFYEEVLIGLYLRIGTAVKHHPSDLNQYLTAWKYWREIINSMI